MAKIDITSALEQIKNNELGPAYYLLGKEKFFHDQFIEAIIKQTFPERASKDLNLSVLYGTENTLSELLSACLSYPMLSDRKLVLVRDFDKMKLSDTDALKKYLDNPQKTTCLVLSASEKSRLKIYDQLSKIAQTVDCSPIPEYKTADWITAQCKVKGHAIEGSAVQFLATLLGNSLLSIEQELNKIIDFKNDDSAISIADLEQTTGISKEANIFALQRALARRQLASSLKIAARLVDTGTDITQINAVLFAFFKKLLSVSSLLARGTDRRQIGEQMKLRDFQLKELFEASSSFGLSQVKGIIGVLHETDLASKTSNINNNSAVQMLCYKICRM